jgi:hypothetical protein
MVNGDDRGQLLLLAALIVAATILGSIALLNSIHESPEIATQQDSRSLQETEWVTDQTGTNLERLFRYVTSVEDADIPLPYAEKPAFRNAVKDYDEQFLNLSTVSSSGLVTVSYNDSASRTGGIAHGDISDASSAPGGNPKWLVHDADAVPRLRLNVTQGISNSPQDYLSVKFNQSKSGPTAELNITGDTGDPGTATVKFVNTTGTQLWTCEFDGDTNTPTVDIRAGSAIVQTDTDKFCERAPVTIPDSVWIRIVDGATTTAKGNFTITGVNASSASSLPPNVDKPAWYREEINGNDILVDPVFEIVYESPEVSYEGEYTLYGDNR